MTHKEAQLGLIKAQKFQKFISVRNASCQRNSVTKQFLQLYVEVETCESPLNTMPRLFSAEHETQVQVHKPCLGCASGPLTSDLTAPFGCVIMFHSFD